MTVYLWDVIDLTGLKERLAQGYVKVQHHPEYPYAILNYTDKCQFDSVWDEVTMNCRGLIYHLDTQEVIARGMPKFFNWGQPQAPQFVPNDLVHVADKADGSLGIIYPTPEGGFAVATRGSFTSDQALHATSLLQTYRVDQHWSQTNLVEIVYPENRIVVDYGDRDELVPLGVVDNLTGRFQPDTGGVGSMGVMTYAEALALPPRPNAEGLVLTRSEDGAMVKVKQEDYLALHRVIFGLSERAIWQLMVNGEDVNQWIVNLPDEFMPWAKSVVQRIEKDVSDKVASLHFEFEVLCAELDNLYGFDAWERRDFAVRAKENPESWALFSLLDGRDIEPVVLTRMKPEGNLTPVRPRTEDEA